MSLTKIIEEMQRQYNQAKTEEHARLQDIANITTVEFAEEAAGALDPRKHAYSFGAYLKLLNDLEVLILAGMPPELALDSVQTGWSTDIILSIWRMGK